MNGISALTRETPESFLALFLPREDRTTIQLSAGWERALIGTPPRGHPDFRLPVP